MYTCYLTSARKSHKLIDVSEIDSLRPKGDQMRNYYQDDDRLEAEECPCANDRAEDCTQHGPRWISESDVR